MTLVKLTRKNAGLLKFCPDHNVPLIQEQLFGATGRHNVQYFRCPVGQEVYEDRPESAKGISL